MIPKTDDLFKWADYYRSIGCSVIPLREGKLPAVAWKEFQSRRADRVELMKWFVDSGWGMAIVCGGVSENLIRLDFDDPKDYEELKGQLPPEVPVFRSQRQGGGYGVLMRSPEPVPTLPQKTFKNRPKLEVRGEGSITVVPPTQGYKWLKLEQIPQLHVHRWLKDVLDFDLLNRDRLARSVETSATDELSSLLKETTEGERSNNLVRIAGMLRARGIDLETALEVMQHNFEKHWPQDGMDWEEAKGIFEGGFKRYAHEGVRVTGQRRQYATSDEDEEGEEVQAFRLDEIRAPTESDSLIEKLVLAGEEGNTVIAAPAKMGKTSLVLDASITATRGLPAWGLLAVRGPMRIAYIDQERKFLQIRENQLLMSSVIGEPDYSRFLLLAQKTGQFQVDHGRIMGQLYARLEEFCPDLVVLDGWGWFVGHRASDPEYVRPAMTWLKSLRQSLGCATIVIHHFKKTQYASGRETIEVDSLDRIEGLKRLVDQAQTALVYTPITGYDTFNLLTGRTNKPAWDPPKTVIDYDHTTLTHRAIAAEEGMELFDPETYRDLWGRESSESRRVKGMMNVIRNRNGCSQTELASMLGVDKSQVSRWYSGRQNPGQAAMERLGELYRKAKERPLKAARMPKVAKEQNERVLHG